MKNIRIFLSENFQFLEVKFSIYLNRACNEQNSRCTVLFSLQLFLPGLRSINLMALNETILMIFQIIFVMEKCIKISGSNNPSGIPNLYLVTVDNEIKLFSHLFQQ